MSKQYLLHSDTDSYQKSRDRQVVHFALRPDRSPGPSPFDQGAPFATYNTLGPPLPGFSQWPDLLYPSATAKEEVRAAHNLEISNK